MLRALGMRAASIALVVCFAGCAVVAEPGWQARLADEIGPAAAPATAGALVPPVDADPGTGDRLEFLITLADGDERKSWRLAVSVGKLATYKSMYWRGVLGFEERVQPGAERRRRIAEATEAMRARGGDFDDLATDMLTAGIVVEAFADDGASLGRAESSALAAKLRTGLLEACHAGHRQRDLMRGRVDAGEQAPMLEVDDAAYDDIRTAAAGAALCEELFGILQSNPVTRQILREVLALPSLWSILTNWGVKVSFTIDFFAAERVDPARFPGESRELWSVPLVLLLNDQPGFLARVIVGPSGSPDGVVAGIYGIVARHPSDAQRTVRVQLQSSRRGEAAR